MRMEIAVPAPARAGFGLDADFVKQRSVDQRDHA